MENGKVGEMGVVGYDTAGDDGSRRLVDQLPQSQPRVRLDSGQARLPAARLLRHFYWSIVYWGGFADRADQRIDMHRTLGEGYVAIE